MSGDDRQRHCELCELNVFNVGGMTTGEVERLVLGNKGQLCVRLYRRADGTVITKDCPVGLRAYRKRVASFAGAAFAAVLGLFSVNYGQSDRKDDPGRDKDLVTVSASTIKTVRTDRKGLENILAGTVLDPSGAVVAGAEVILTPDDGCDEPMKTTPDVEGVFRFRNVPQGQYTLWIGAAAFKNLTVSDVEIQKEESVNLELKLTIDENAALMGTTAPILSNVVTTDQIKDLPSTNILRRSLGLPPPKIP
jgi:hypothetical protein